MDTRLFMNLNATLLTWYRPQEHIPAACTHAMVALWLRWRKAEERAAR